MEDNRTCREMWKKYKYNQEGKNATYICFRVGKWGEDKQYSFAYQVRKTQRE